MRVTLNSLLRVTNLWPTDSRSNWNLEMLVFVERGKPLGARTRTNNKLNPHDTFRAEKHKKHAWTLRERGAPKGSKMAAILIFLFSTIHYATADIPVSSNNYPTQEESCRCILAVVWFSYGFLNFKKDFKVLDVPAACKQIASTGLLLSWTFLQKATI